MAVECKREMQEEMQHVDFHDTKATCGRIVVSIQIHRTTEEEDASLEDKVEEETIPVGSTRFAHVLTLSLENRR